MTQQQITLSIVEALQNKIVDSVNAEKAISKAFDNWFSMLLSPAPAPVEAPPAEEAAA